jgi:hypothetical protein
MAAKWTECFGYGADDDDDDDANDNEHEACSVISRAGSSTVQHNSGAGE